MSHFRLCRPAFICAMALASAFSFGAQADEAGEIQAGRSVANIKCFACHIVSPAQTIQPIYRVRLPSFEDIANKPETTEEGLMAFLKTTHWQGAAPPPDSMPAPGISDRERAQVVRYILSLKKPPSER